MNEPTDHYDQTYFKEHYPAVLDNACYYQLLALHWGKAIFNPLVPFGVPPEVRLLDFGCGTGVVSGAMKCVVGCDVSDYARAFLRKKGRQVFESVDQIPEREFDAVLCSHSLEHYADPKQMLLSFGGFVRQGGYLILVLPIDADFTPTTCPDNNQHLYCWNFQSITNLLLHCHWRPLFAKRIYGPFLLNTLGRCLPSHIAVRLAYGLGQIKRAFPSMLILAKSE